MGLKEDIDAALDKRLRNYPKAKKVLDFLRSDVQTNVRCSISNDVTVKRLGYTDHGAIHARIVAFSSLKMLEMLYARGLRPNIMQECNSAKFEDAAEAVVAGGYLHDIGNAILREGHDFAAFVTAHDILNRIYSKPTELNERKKALILETVLCHMGNYHSTSLEAKIVPIADGCDMEEGRARIPYQRGNIGIHGMSALAIKTVRIKEGAKKPIRINVEMDSSAGIFQIEENLLKKIKGAQMEKYVEISAYISSRKETINYLAD